MKTIALEVLWDILSNNPIMIIVSLPVYIIFNSIYLIIQYIWSKLFKKLKNN